MSALRTALDSRRAEGVPHEKPVNHAGWRAAGLPMHYDYFAIRKFERLIVRITLGLDADTAEAVETYGPTSVLVSIHDTLEGEDRDLFLLGLGNALEKNANRRALSRMVLFASKHSLEIHDSIDILADWFVKNRMSDPAVYEALDTYWRRKFRRGFEEEP